MTSCNYRVLNDIYNTIEEELTAISEKIENLELNIDIAEIDVDLDNIERQLTLNNKLRLLELVGVDVMSEEEQLKLLASDGMLVKRPLIISDSFILVGFKEAEWSEKLG